MEDDPKYKENNLNVAWQIAYRHKNLFTKESIETKHYNTSYSELKHELNQNSETQKYLNWSMVDKNIKYTSQVFRCKRGQLKGVTICKIRSNECSNTNLNRSNFKGSKVETNDAIGYNKLAWTCRKKNQQIRNNGSQIQVIQYGIESA